MKTLRIATMVAVLSLAAGAVAQAQDPQTQGQRPGRGMNVQALLTGITLTPAQQQQVDSLQKKFNEENQAMRAEMQGGGDREAMMTKMRDARTKQLDQIRGVLTDEQTKVFDKNVEEMRSRRPQRPPSR